MLSVIRRVCPETIAQINVILFINESNSLLSRSSTATVNVIWDFDKENFYLKKAKFAWTAKKQIANKNMKLKA